MKKRSKIFLFTTIGLLLLIAVGAIIGIAVKNNYNNISGCTYIDKPTTGTGVEDWCRYYVDIPYNTMCTEKYYTNKSGDYITNIIFYYTTQGGGGIGVYYYDYFWFFDDFEAFFVFSNKKTGSEEVRYQTFVSYSHWAGDDGLVFDEEHLDPSGSNTTDILETFYIVEVWIRTDD